MKLEAFAKKVSQSSGARTFVLLLSIFFLFVPQLSFSHPSAASREKKWHKDLKALRKQLRSLHANLFFKMTPEEFNQAVDDLEASISALQDHEIIVAMTRIVALVGDAHTRLDWEQTATSFRTYPLRLYWFSNGLYVRATTADYRSALGAKLVQIGETDIDRVYASVSSLIPHDNDGWLRQRTPGYMVVPEILNALKILPDMEKGHFVFEDDQGDRFALDVVPLSQDSPIAWLQWPDPAAVSAPLYQKNPELFYWFEYLGDSKTLYFKYNVAANMNTRPVEVFAEQLASFVGTHPVDRFIIDMRDNGGGDSSILFRLLAGLPGRFDFNQRGHFFVVIGRNTFSSAVINAVDLKKQTQAIFVGEPTGGKPNSYGEVRTLFLPKSGLAVRYSTRFFKLLEDDPPSFNPDITAQLSSTDYAAGQDPVWEALQTATVNPAKFLGLEKSFGTVETGKVADLVLLDADPLNDIRNTKRISAVIANGRYLSKARLDEMLRHQEHR